MVINIGLPPEGLCPAQANTPPPASPAAIENSNFLQLLLQLLSAPPSKSQWGNSPDTGLLPAEGKCSLGADPEAGSVQERANVLVQTLFPDGNILPILPMAINVPETGEAIPMIAVMQLLLAGEGAALLQPEGISALPCNQEVPVPVPELLATPFSAGAADPETAAQALLTCGQQEAGRKEVRVQVPLPPGVAKPATALSGEHASGFPAGKDSGTLSQQSQQPVAANDKLQEIKFAVVVQEAPGESPSVPPEKTTERLPETGFGEMAVEVQAGRVAGNGVKGATLEPVPEQVFQAIKAEMQLQLSLKKDGLSEVRIKLKPESLGEVVIKIASKDGKVSGKIVVETIPVKEALESRLPMFKERLTQVNVEVTGMDVSLGQDSGANHGGSLPVKPGWPVSTPRETGSSEIDFREPAPEGILNILV